jgi:hypothetical protein
MSRWHARLVELRASREGTTAAVQYVQNVQNSPPVPTFEHSEQFEQRGKSADSWTDADDERAAIIEHDGGVPRAWAEALARLDPTGPPAGVPLTDWNRLIDAGCRLVDDGWHKQANALGWGPLELFGCDRTFPMRPEAKGLLWRLGELCRNSGDTHLIALTAHGALVETGKRDIYLRRNPPVPGQVLTWEVGEWRRTG